MDEIELFAVEHYGWTLEEFGPAKEFLISMRDMLRRELQSIHSGEATVETYGYRKREHNKFITWNIYCIDLINRLFGRITH